MGAACLLHHRAAAAAVDDRVVQILTVPAVEGERLLDTAGRGGKKSDSCFAAVLAGQVICEGGAAVHGAGPAAALQLREPAVLCGEGDGGCAPEGMLQQTPALPATAGPHGHHGQSNPLPSDVSSRVRKTHIHQQMATFCSAL